MSDRHTPLEPLQRAQLELATSKYAAALGGSDKAVQWALSRGLNQATVERFRLGYADPEVAAPQHGMYRGMIAIPFLSGDDRHPVMLRFRCIEEHDHRANGHGKYNSMSGEANRMFNSPTILEADPSETIHVCEGECFPDGAEVLTPRGWVDFADLADDEVAQWNDDGSIEFVKPLAYIEKDFDGELVNFKHKGIEMTVTPGHRVPFFTKHTRKFRRADEVKQGGWFPRAGVLDGEGTGYSKDELALMLAISADMTVRHPKNNGYNGRVDRLPYVYGAFAKVRKMHRLSGLLERLGIEYNATRMDGYMQYTFHLPEKYAFDKMLDHSLLAKMSSEEAEFILSELIEWDGNLVPNRNQTEYSTKHEANAIWVQTVAHLAGRVSTLIHRRNEYGEWIKVSILHGKSSSSWQGMKRTDVSYKGKVRCVTVPSGAILVRQHGYVTVSGNCDAMTLEQLGYRAVAITGANAFKKHHAIMLEGVPRVAVWGDGDKAGHEFTASVLKFLRGTALGVGVPDGMDVNELYLTGGRDAIDDLIKKTLH